MITNEEIKRLKKALNIDKISAEVVGTVVGTREDLKEFRQETTERLNRLEDSVDNLTNSVDKLVKAVEKLSQEYSAITVQIERHDKWIQQIAEKVGVELKS